MSDPSVALLASWSRNAQAWAVAVRTGQIRSREALTNSAIVQAILACQPRQVLDVGCGEGWLGRALAEHGVRVTGVDACAELVALAKEGGGLDIHCLPYARLIDQPQQVGSAFDVMVCNFSLLDEHVSELLNALAQIATPQGRLLIQTLHPLSVEPPYRDGWRLERFEPFGAEHWQPMPWYYRTLSNWTRTLAPGWVLESLVEPQEPGAPLPASLLLGARRASGTVPVTG